MTKLIHMQGDIFTTRAPAIAHGVNTKGLMGAGIAKTVRSLFPDMYEHYRLTCENNRMRGGDVLPWMETHPDGSVTYIYNIASQELPGSNASYDFLVQGVYTALEWAQVHGVDRIAFPRIGSGIGGLREDIVEAILATLAAKSSVDIELWTYAS